MAKLYYAWFEKSHYVGTGKDEQDALKDLYLESKDNCRLPVEFDIDSEGNFQVSFLLETRLVQADESILTSHDFVNELAEDLETRFVAGEFK